MRRIIQAGFTEVERDLRKKPFPEGKGIFSSFVAMSRRKAQSLRRCREQE